jgi:hypothetical protein
MINPYPQYSEKSLRMDEGGDKRYGPTPVDQNC